MNDKQLISQFLDHLYDWLEACLSRTSLKHPWPLIFVRAELASSAREAWAAFERDFPKEPLIHAALQHYDESSKSHGLYGAQLAYKLKTIELVAAEGRNDSPGWKRKLLDILDNLLESIGEGVPGYGAFKELKDSLLAGAD